MHIGKRISMHSLQAVCFNMMVAHTLDFCVLLRFLSTVSNGRGQLLVTGKATQMSLSCRAGASYYSDWCIRHRGVSSVVSRVQSYIISLYNQVIKTVCLGFFRGRCEQHRDLEFSWICLQ